jgi:hypothetical protein
MEAWKLDRINQWLQRNLINEVLIEIFFLEILEDVRGILRMRAATLFAETLQIEAFTRSHSTSRSKNS